MNKTSPVPGESADIDALNKSLEEMARASSEAETFLSALSGAIFPGGAPTREQLTWSGGGHAGAATGKVERIPTPGTWLGGMKEIGQVTVNSGFKLEPGDLLLLYTDGVTEAMNADGELLDMDRLCDAVEAAQKKGVAELRDHLIATVKKWMDRQEDDITLMVIRYLGAGGAQADAAAPLKTAAAARFAASSLFDGEAPRAPEPELERAASGPGRLAVAAASHDRLLGIALTGFAEVPDKEGLQQTLTVLHRLAWERRVTVVELDVRRLKFMNSSCFKELVTWLARVEALPEDRHYQLRLVADPLVRWQKTSLAALAAFAPRTVLSER